MTYGTYEARLAEILTDFESTLPKSIKLAYLPASGIIKLRLTAVGKVREELEEEINEQVRILYKTIPDYIYGENEESIEMVIANLLKEKKKTVCTAESCTGGEIAHLITSIPGCSSYYLGSVIAYANSAKVAFLGLNNEILERYGAVSEEVVRELAIGARNKFKTDFAVATSGIAGPDGGTEIKPVGTLCIAVASEKEVVYEKRVFGNDRVTNIKRFSLAALNLLRKQIISS
jgi:nicotinamide-nucleotide amidase